MRRSERPDPGRSDHLEWRPARLFEKDKWSNKWSKLSGAPSGEQPFPGGPLLLTELPEAALDDTERRPQPPTLLRAGGCPPLGSPSIRHYAEVSWRLALRVSLACTIVPPCSVSGRPSRVKIMHVPSLRTNNR